MQSFGMSNTMTPLTLLPGLISLYQLHIGTPMFMILHTNEYTYKHNHKRRTAMTQTKQKPIYDKSLYAWAAVRLAIGFTFLWAFFDKLLGLGFSTCRDASTNVVNVMCEQSWYQGGSPTAGFLKFATKGPLADFYQGFGRQYICRHTFLWPGYFL